jgi:hypothetical protein
MNICKVDGCNNEVDYKGKGLCKKCYKKAHYKANKEKIRAKHKEYREANKEAIKAQNRKHYIDNREEKISKVRELRCKKPLYDTWQGMKKRCNNPNNDNYKYYGGRGIKVCERWLNSYENFALDMGERPKGHTLDRINNDGNYEPSNCKWSSLSEQNSNRRNSRK